MDQGNQKEEEQADDQLRLPNGDRFKADTLVENDRRSPFFISGLMPAGKILGRMDTWRVVEF